MYSIGKFIVSLLSSIYWEVLHVRAASLAHKVTGLKRVSAKGKQAKLSSLDCIYNLSSALRGFGLSLDDFLHGEGPHPTLTSEDELLSRKWILFLNDKEASQNLDII